MHPPLGSLPNETRHLNLRLSVADIDLMLHRYRKPHWSITKLALSAGISRIEVMAIVRSQGRDAYEEKG